jgi:hypothetical protein
MMMAGFGRGGAWSIDQGKYPLTMACLMGSVDQVRQLLQSGADKDGCDDKGNYNFFYLTK